MTDRILARTDATSLPSSRIRAHASRAIAPLALGIEQNPSGVPERMSGKDQFGSVSFHVIAIQRSEC